MKANRRIVQVAFVCSLFAMSFGAFADAPIPPTFEGVTFAASQPKCGVGSFTFVLSPDNSALSVLRTAKTKNDIEFLAVGAGYAPRHAATCTLKVVLKTPLAVRRTLSVDYRGAELKGPASSVNMKIMIGPQTHTTHYARGRFIDGGPGTELKRFLVDLPKGTKTVPIHVSGSAVSFDKLETTLIGLEALDMCFVDPEHPEFCGMGGKPNEGAKN